MTTPTRGTTRRRILIVDDDPGDRLTVRAVLEDYALCESAHDTASALQLAARGTWHAVLVDYRLQHSTSYDLAVQLDKAGHPVWILSNAEEPMESGLVRRFVARGRWLSKADLPRLPDILGLAV